jgi:hypothetical protein
MAKDLIGYAEEITKMKNMLFTLDYSTLTLEKIILIFREIMDGKEEPLDGDAVELLVECLHKCIDLHEGNITEEEYNNE